MMQVTQKHRISVSPTLLRAMFLEPRLDFKTETGTAEHLAQHTEVSPLAPFKK